MMRRLLRAKIGFDALTTWASLMAPLGATVNSISASPWSMPWRIASRGNATSPIPVLWLGHTTPADSGPVCCTGAACTGAITVGAGGGVAVTAAITLGVGGGV